MKPITSQTVDEAALFLESLENEEEMEALIDAFGEDQPLVLTYLMSIGEHDLNDDERELLLYLGLFFWKAIKMAGLEMMSVTEDGFAQLKEENLSLLEAAEGSSVQTFGDAWKKATQGYAQPELLSFLLESLDDEEGVTVREKNRNALQSYAKIALDSLLA